MNLPNKPLAIALVSSLCLGFAAPVLAENNTGAQATPVAQAQTVESSTIVDIAVGADNFKI
jgi:hypothetical protein